MSKMTPITDEIPAEAGIQLIHELSALLDPRLRGDFERVNFFRNDPAIAKRGARAGLSPHCG
jgi:hypothetical protein